MPASRRSCKVRRAVGCRAGFTSSGCELIGPVGIGVGIFFFGYFIFEVPSNLILEKVGARRWIARIMISWGMISAAFAFVPAISETFQSAGASFFDKPRTFYFMRFIFGAAEAGFFPGVALYLTYWFTADERARWLGVFYTALPLSFVIGGPIS